ncbi:hypothetical protein DPMN_009140 [Dreissena polymorpha]|uniref:Uncharacterized protein n=1 Tax=Dreissena polymorpha TaxID=45954 RepID=A0A9D4RZS9_DREPO|nr:hypothetical protein DPMN_009140 [Dreissena polymorpha]
MSCYRMALPETIKQLRPTPAFAVPFYLVAINVQILSSGRDFFEPTTSRVVVRHFNHVAKELALEQGCWK